MSTVGIVVEKNSAAKKFAAALGGPRGTYKGEDYVIVPLRGHVVEFHKPNDPKAVKDPAKAEKYASWELENLPWDPADLSWAREVRGDAGGVISSATRALQGVSEIVVATDLDPTGEGDLIAVEFLQEAGLDTGRKYTRMMFTDESEPALRKAFENRVPIPDLNQHGPYKKALFRSKFDYLSIQSTRVATKAAGQRMVLPQGRLKSAIVGLVGAQKAAYEAYKKVPFYQNRFKDENGVVYTDPEAPMFATRDEVPGGLVAGRVLKDEPQEKRTAPPKLPDLAKLSSLLSTKGVKAKDVLGTYQKMYEDQVVSYPRTEDKVITTEQFNELLPLVDRIAAVVGADVSLLTHRTPRSTHVKDKNVAHGANRPGPNVPSSLESLSSYGAAAPMIYEILAKAYLSMLAEDYVYMSQTGRVEGNESYVGRANTPKSLGFKAVFDVAAEEGDKDEDESASGLGEKAEPFVHEGFPPRPPYPTMTWLIKQLEKHDVGTGATRTSTYAEVTNEKNPNRLMSEKRGKIDLTASGEMSYRLLPGTTIGDLSLTERVYEQMRQIEAGTLEEDEALAPVADWIRSDIDLMRANAAVMRKELGLKEVKVAERASGTWNGREVSFKREFCGHRFTDEEVADLLGGAEITFEAVSPRTGKPFTAVGSLGEREFKGKTFVGFSLKERPEGVPDAWAGHTFTDEEKAKLEAGESVGITDARNKEGNPLKATVKYGYEKKGDTRKKILLDHWGVVGDDTVPDFFSGRRLTDDEKARLAAGEGVYVDGIKSKKTGNPYGTTLWFEEEPGGVPGVKRLIPDFVKNPKPKGSGAKGGSRGGARGRRK